MAGGFTGIVVNVCAHPLSQVLFTPTEIHCPSADVTNGRSLL